MGVWLSKVELSTRWSSLISTPRVPDFFCMLVLWWVKSSVRGRHRDVLLLQLWNQFLNLKLNSFSLFFSFPQTQVTPFATQGNAEQRLVIILRSPCQDIHLFHIHFHQVQDTHITFIFLLFILSYQSTFIPWDDIFIYRDCLEVSQLK